MRFSHPRLASLSLAVFGMTLPHGLSARAQVVVAPPPTVGSSNPVSAEPLVSRPPGTPCVVQLFQDTIFNDFNPRTYSYTPPAGCPGPWAKVVFTADFTVSAGIQYDRSPEFFLGNYTITGVQARSRTPRSVPRGMWNAT